MQQPLPPVAVGAAPDDMTCEDVAKAMSRGASCMAACTALAATDPASVHCRWSHCELAVGGESRVHCTHAVDDSVCPLAAVAGDDCKNRSLRLWACNDDEECCSNRCAGNFCQ
jgi:hypothetical protein